jgi:hypothetical protein
MWKLERLTDRRNLDAENKQGESFAVVPTRKAFVAASPHLEWPPRSNRPTTLGSP